MNGTESVGVDLNPEPRRYVTVMLLTQSRLLALEMLKEKYVCSIIIFDCMHVLLFTVLSFLTIHLFSL
jgi:hypothetical protein